MRSLNIRYSKIIIHDINGKVLSPGKDEKGEEVPVTRQDYAKEAIGIITNELNPLRATSGNIYKLFTLNGLHFYGKRKGSDNDKEKDDIHLHIKAENGEQYSVNYSHIPGIFLNNIQKTIEGIPTIQRAQENVLRFKSEELDGYKELVKNKGSEWEKESVLQKAIEELKEVTKRLEDSNKEPLKKIKQLLNNYIENGGDFDDFIDSIEDIGIESIDTIADRYRDDILWYEEYGSGVVMTEKGITGREETYKYLQNKFIEGINKQIETLSKQEQQAAEQKENNKSTDDKIRIGDLSFTLGSNEFVTLATAQNRKGEDVTVVRINTQIESTDCQRYVKPLITLYGGEWNTSNKVVIFQSAEEAKRFKQQVESKFPELADSYESPRFRSVSQIGYYSTVENNLSMVS